MGVSALFANLRHPRVRTSSLRQAFHNTEFNLEMERFELLRYFGPQENEENINTLGKNRILDIRVPSVQTGT